MALVENLDVSLTSVAANHFWGRNIDSPKTGSQSENYAINVRGWVLGRSNPAVAVEVVSESGVLRRVPIDQRRPDVASAYPKAAGAWNSGFHTTVSTLGLPANFELVVRAVQKGNRRTPIGSIRGRRSELQSHFQPKLQPLMLTTLGRAGSTWTIHVLAQHSEIIAYRPFRYEPRVSRYWLHILKTLSDPASYLQPIAGSDKTSDYWWIGDPRNSNVAQLIDPRIQQWLERDSVESLINICQDRIDAFYQQVAMAQNRTTPLYFAEKYLPDSFVPMTMWELYSHAREIFLVRDFRDVVCSILAFNTQRGYAAFGRERATSNAEYIRQTRTGIEHLRGSWKQRSDRAYLLRYEDLISYPTETLGDLLKYLELDASPATVEGMLQRASEEVPGQEQHRTSPDPEKSIGRWRRDLDPSLQAVCQEAFGDVLEEFGYEL